MLLSRFYQNLDQYLKPNRVLVIYGPRRVGKTTLLQQYLRQTKYTYKLDSGDNILVQQVLSSRNFEQIFEYARGYDLIALDEAQHIPQIGWGLKILADEIPGIRIIATGSSSFELSGQVGEPLTGRKRTLILYPLSQLELKNHYNQFELEQKLPEFLIFGSYPEVLVAKSKKEKRVILEELVGSYLLKDVLELEKIKSAKILLDLLRLLAFQVGSEVSLTELGSNLGIDRKTVSRYLDLFEKSFIVFNLRGYSRNLRTEIVKKSKYYFYDNGVRNALIANFNPPNLRNDLGQLWENFVISERIKYQHYRQIFANNYFWRTWSQQEIDWVEERKGKLFGYEIKWGTKKGKLPSEWRQNYPKAKFKTINQKNYLSFVS
ncbi:MAG: ATP-binding protein [Microgenomates group bacterium]